MNAEWIVTGIILLGSMAAGGASLYLKRRKQASADSFGDTQNQPDSKEN